MRVLQRAGALLAAAAVVVAPLAAAGPSWGATGTSFTRLVERVHLVDGKDVVADRRTVKVSVASTEGLRDRQSIRVTWTGAHPTNLAVSDPNTEAASQQEWPMVVLQCRGVDSTSVPAAQRLRPETCWTQTPAERFFLSDAVYPPWRVDRHATAAERGANLGQPSPYPSKCQRTGYQERWLHFAAVDGADYPGGLGGCGGMAAESAAVDSKQSMPPNTTYATTDAQGNGSAKFTVWTSQTNASLGCTDKVACSLVVIPIAGTSCDVAAQSLPAGQRPAGDDADYATQLCQAAGGGSFAAPAVTGKLWWTASNWRNRVSVPLHFSPLPSDCALSSSKSAVVYGSELLAQATQSWATGLCRDAGAVPLRHVQVGEPQTRNLLTLRSIDAGFVSDPPDSGGSPHVLAPTALTGFAISYVIDDAHGDEYRSLRLTPRLLAKLLTMSYPAVVAEQKENPGLVNNPLNMSLDPEFQALNPGIKQGVGAGESAAALYSLSSDSDVLEALTSYLQADPEARAWLDGKPDPWGMTVNPAYKGISLPVHAWPLLDDVKPPSIYNDSNKCLQANPVPFLPLVAAPTARLASISLAVQFAIAPAQLVCYLPPDGDVAGAKLVALGRQTVGSRFLIGVTTLGDARRYDLDTAALQTRVLASAAPDLRSLSGRDFAAPTDAALRAAGAELEPDKDRGTWSLPMSALAGPAAAPDAYPGTMLVSTLVPTTGLTPAAAGRYASFLRFVAGPAQRSGTTAGRLPSGYLPLTSANGLGALSAYTARAADAVRAQAGAVPALDPAAPSPAPAPAPGPSGGGGSGPSMTGGSSTPNGTAAQPAVAPAVLPPARTPGVPAPETLPVAATAVTRGAVPGVLGTALPALLGVGLTAGLGWLVLTLRARGSRA